MTTTEIKQYLESKYQEPYLNIAKAQVVSYCYKDLQLMFNMSTVEERMMQLTKEQIESIIDFSGIE